MTHSLDHLDVLSSFWYLETTAGRTGQQTPPYTVLFSGGQDSMSALWLMHHATQDRAQALQTLHYNHLWRGENFFMADHVTKISFWLNRPQQMVLPTYTVTTEHAASQWRRWMTTHLTRTRAPQTIINGHTQTDQQESALFSAIRELTGTSVPSQPTGLPAYTPEPGLDGDWLRPLSQMRRMETGLLVRAQHLPVYPDMTNIACDNTRAQLRYILLPLLTKLGF